MTTINLRHELVSAAGITRKTYRWAKTGLLGKTWRFASSSPTTSKKKTDSARPSRPSTSLPKDPCRSLKGPYRSLGLPRPMATHACHVSYSIGGLRQSPSASRLSHYTVSLSEQIPREYIPPPIHPWYNYTLHCLSLLVKTQPIYLHIIT